MAKNWALVIGINEYNPLNFPPLKYAKRDAERVKAFFETAGFERVFFFSDDSPRQTLPNGIEIPTQATYGNLISFLQGFFEQRFLNTGDNFWFFFAGHGERYHDEDYLMPMDASAIGSEVIAGLKVNYVRERLCRSGADNIILILDACRSQGSRDGSGLGLEVQPGVITITSCQPKQKSWEVDELEQGVFTYALLEALQLPGEQSCATVERLGGYLKWRVPDLCQRYGKAPAQVPRIGADPIEKQHFILIPQYARQADLDLLKLDAYRLRNTNPALAERICLRLNALALGRDLEVIDLLTDLRRQARDLPPAPLELTPPPTDLTSARSAATATTTTVGNVVDDNFSLPQTELTDTQAAGDNLNNEKEIDYTRLRDLLKLRAWRAADEETYKVMIRAVGKKSGNWLTNDELLNLPCVDLSIIDQLWVKYSQGNFGFSVQKQIYVECGAQLDGKYPGDHIWYEFCDRVGWRKGGKYQLCAELKANPSLSPVGEFPFRSIQRFGGAIACWWVFLCFNFQGDDEVQRIEAELKLHPPGPKPPRKELPECDLSKILFIKNVRDPDGGWAYTLDRIQKMGGSVSSRVFELFWLPGSKGARSASKGDLMLLNQQAKITHVVEMLDDDVRENSAGYFRWVRVVWMSEETDWSRLPHQREVLGFIPPTIGGGTAYLLANLGKFQEAWDSLEAFQQHVFQVLTGAKPPEVEDYDVDDLNSERGIDYTRLRDLLRARDWRAADQETYRLMITTVGKEEGQWFDDKDLEEFPREELHTLDQLWVKYSHGHFGFSVQKEVWKEYDSPTTLGDEWDEFCVKLGWQDSTESRYMSEDELIYDPKKSPIAELPATFLLCGIGSLIHRRYRSLLSRRDL